MGYSLNDNLTLFSSIGYTYRVPTFTDLYYTDPVNIGNPNLLPEFAWNYEIGMKTRATNLVSAQASLFYRAGGSMIDWVRRSDTDPWEPINLLFVEMAGLDADVSFNLAGLYPAKNPLFESFNINYTYIYSHTDDYETFQSRYALENLRHQLRGSFALSYGDKIKHSISAGYYDRVNLDDYAVVDSRLMYQGKKLNIFIDVTNIFDVEYQETNLVVMPGRWFKAGVSVKVF
jgi:vitamin B12 transporter